MSCGDKRTYKSPKSIKLTTKEVEGIWKVEKKVRKEGSGDESSDMHEHIRMKVTNLYNLYDLIMLTVVMIDNVTVIINH